MLTQKDDRNNEQPISFMSVSLQGPELNYLAIDKKPYVICKAIKHFLLYLLKNHFIIFVSHPVVRSVFVQREMNERRENTMTGLQEYDLEFKPVHTIKGHGIFWIAAEAVDVKEEYLSSLDHEIEMYNVEQASPTTIMNSW